MSETTPHDHSTDEHTGAPDAAAGSTTADGAERATEPAQGGQTPEDVLETARAEAAQLKDQFLRKIAEFENFKRRTREEKDLLMKYGAEGVLLDLLPVIDDFERSIAAAREHDDATSIAQGVEIIYGKFMRVLENRGLRPMDAKGKPFDVAFHDALLQVPSADVEPGMVLEVVEKGYLLHDKVIRHAKVTVSREADAEGAA
jgi:molecular chaperone GrpE